MLVTCVVVHDSASESDEPTAWTLLLDATGVAAEFPVLAFAGQSDLEEQEVIVAVEVDDTVMTAGVSAYGYVLPSNVALPVAIAASAEEPDC